MIEDAAHAVDSKRWSVKIWNDGIIVSMREKSSRTEGGASRVSRTELAWLRYCGILSRFEARYQQKAMVAVSGAGYMPKKLRQSLSPGGVGALRRLTAASYREKLAVYQRELPVGWFAGRWMRPKMNNLYFTYTIRVLNQRRDDLADIFGTQHHTTLRYEPLHLIPIYKSHSKLPISEQLNEEALSIPLHPRLTENEVQYIVDSIKSFPG